MPHHAPKVALLIETSRGYGRGLLRGVSKYSRLHGPWQFHLTPGDFEQIVPKMKDWDGNGIIARVMDRRTARLVLETGLPAVLLDLPTELAPQARKHKAGLLEMASDSVGAASLVAECFLEKQFRHFAFIGYRGQVWSKIREDAFVARLRENGLESFVYEMPVRRGRPVRWEEEEHGLARWLSELPKPVGVLACNDQRGREVLSACALAGIAVPEKVAVIGVDNDDLLCELSFPPLSSVTLNAVQGGFLAAKRLDAMMRGEPCETGPIIVPPLRIVERRSSEVVALDDPEIAAAMQYIHTQPPGQISIGLMVKSLALSRRTLEMKFKKALGRTLLQEIHAVRLARACAFLQETDLPIPQIAEMTGFGTPSYLIQVFRAELGMPPAKYRKALRE